MRIKSTIVYFVTFILVTQPSWGWGVVGHQTVGRIAAALLTPAAREKVADILGVDNTKADVADAMADAAEWPDKVARTEFLNPCRGISSTWELSPIRQKIIRC